MRRIPYIFLLSVLLPMASMAEGPQLRILTTQVPPMAFVKGGKLQGFCVEIVELIQRRVGSADAITVLPWARAYQQAQTEPNIMLVCPKRTMERERKFQWVGPLLSTHTGIYVKTGALAKLTSKEQAKRISSILVVRASYVYQDLARDGFRNLYEVNNSAAMVRMLMADRAPAMMLEGQELAEVLRNAGIAPQALSSIFEVASPTSNLAFSRDVPVQTVRQWQAAFDLMKKDGSYDKLRDKWFPALDHGQRR